MRLRKSLLGLLFAVSLVPAAMHVLAAAPMPSPATTDNPTLKDTLEKGLKARRPEEFAFIAQVVDLVDRNKLPLSLVQSTFLWAKRHTVHQFQYFQTGLIQRAKDLGIDL